MKHTLTLISLALLLASTDAAIAGTEPFDFDYEIAGNVLERPALVFNDGSATYFQPRAGQILHVEGGHNEGPYVVVPGTPDVIHYSSGQSSATAYWKKTNRFMGDTTRESDDMPSGFAGFSGRLALIGTRTHLESTRPLSATMPLSQMVKTLVPQGWTGSAQKDIDLTASTTFATRDGENWMQSLDRLIAASDMYADVDFDTRHVTLHRAAPKSAAVNYVASTEGAGNKFATQSGTPVSNAADPIAAIAAAAGAGNEAPSQARDSLLASKFGATAIRDGDDSHIQIKFAAKPATELKVVDETGKSLRPKWDDATNVLTINRAERFVVSNGTDQIEMARVAGTVYDFDVANHASLQGVFDKDGATFFKFADTVGHVTVSDVKHLGNGEQKGRFYKFNGTADQFIVNADGNVVNVTRKHDVRFFDRPKTS
jgi:hypothetical protein